MSLSGYEEPAEGETVTEDNTQTTSSSVYGSPSQSQDDSTVPPTKSGNDDDTTMSSNSFSNQTTPRPPATAREPPTIAPYNSPYENLKREVQGRLSQPDTDEPSSSLVPSTPRLHQQSPDPQSSPFHPPSTAKYLSNRTPAKDVLLHRVLDKNWRLQATPHSQARGPGTLPYRVKVAETPQPSPRKWPAHSRARGDDSLDSSPEAPAPTLHAEVFESPLRRPRVPGVSVLTPARRLDSVRGGKARDDIFTTGGGEREALGGVRNIANIWDSDSDDEDGMEGLSPPKTMQFHVPQNRLLRTPGKFLRPPQTGVSYNQPVHLANMRSSTRSKQTDSGRSPPDRGRKHHRRLGRGESERG